MTTELKPCPFCGGEAHHAVYTTAYSVEKHHIECMVCGAEAGYGDSTGGLSWTTKEAAYKQWNNRAESEQSITREHLFKMVKIQDQTLSELHEVNVQLRKDKAELVEALTDVIDGESAYDLVHMTGLNQERCQEIIELVEKIK